MITFVRDLRTGAARTLADRVRASRGAARGYVAIMMAALVASGLFMAAAAVAIDTGRWYTEQERVQKAADAAAMGGVPYLPYDFDNASKLAKEIAARNGYPESTDTVVKVELGRLESQLRVTISTRVHNVFGASFGAKNTVVSRTGMADYKGSAPMGSPCNTFANEPDSGSGSPGPQGTARDTSVADCTSKPDLWGGVQGAQTNKSNGDRFGNEYCSDNATFRCSGGKSNEFEDHLDGYFWIVRVEKEAVGKQIDVQIYDPAYVETGGTTCGSLPDASSLKDKMNSFVGTDGKKRYARGGTNAGTTGAPFCNGDQVPGGVRSGTMDDHVTSFALREQTDTLDPLQGTPINGCTKQFKGTKSTPTYERLYEWNSSGGQSNKYNRSLAQIFHTWYSLCTFTPARAGDYYLQVRTNVEFGGATVANTNGLTPLISSGNAAVTQSAGDYRKTTGSNTFSLRAVVPGYQKYVAVSGYESMPMFVNSEKASSLFHLIRVLPGAAGQSVVFTFFDVSDAGGSSGTVTVKRPADGTGSITTNPFPGGCVTYYGEAGGTTTNLPSCSTTINQTKNNGKLQTIQIPIPSDYSCNFTVGTGCWYKVQVELSGGVRDFTTWQATIEGDPVRLVE